MERQAPSMSRKITCRRRIPRVAEPNLVGSSPFSARSCILCLIRPRMLYPIPMGAKMEVYFIQKNNQIKHIRYNSLFSCVISLEKNTGDRNPEGDSQPT